MLIQNPRPQSIWVLLVVEKALISGGGEKMVEQRIRTRAIRPPHSKRKDILTNCKVSSVACVSDG